MATDDKKTQEQQDAERKERQARREETVTSSKDTSASREPAKDTRAVKESVNAQRRQEDRRKAAQQEIMAARRAASEQLAQDLPEDQPLDKVSDADPTGLSDPNQLASSADPAAEITMPPTKTVPSESGIEVRPQVEPVTIPNATKKDIDRRAASIYGRHSGKVGHTVPIVDDYTVNNPREGGTIGGANGPGAVGRVAAERKKERMAENVVEALIEGANADERLAVERAKTEEPEEGTKYRVVGGAIFTSRGKHVPGDPVKLTSEEAKLFDSMDRLAPYIE